MSQQNPNPQADDAGKNRTKNKRARPFTIESRWNAKSWVGRLFPEEQKQWRTDGRYRTEAERDRAMEQKQRKYDFIDYRKGGDA